MLTGAVMMVFSYFMDSLWLSLLIWAVLAAVPFLMGRNSGLSRRP
ncbi:MAG: hypothetical protein NTW87_05720 [Planctomycetota bacterium]|nr:hypothetical protein [Planctomycetota bacterium]